MSAINEFDLEQIVEPLLAWFRGHARILPWREHPQAYYVWISEIMLQQTRVEAVKPYFERFIQALPTVEALAECPEDVYLKLWEGLGYYNRVRNLNAAAKQILEDYDGVIPSQYEELLKLKGIGHYTAGAIASIAYDQCVPAVDGNVLRVISRVSGDDSDIMKQSVRTNMERVLQELMKRCVERKGQQADSKVHAFMPGAFNQALMELGAIVCVPNGAPHCEECPWQTFCEARRTDRIEELPVKTKAKARRIEEKTVFLIRQDNQIAVRRRPDRGLLAGLYEFPNLPGHLTEGEVQAVLEKSGYEVLKQRRLADAKHVFSHVEWHMEGYDLLVRPKDPHSTQTNSDEFLFVELLALREQYAIPNAFAKYQQYLQEVLLKHSNSVSGRGEEMS